MTTPATAEAPPTQRRDCKPIYQTVSQASCLPLALQLRFMLDERFCGHPKAKSILACLFLLLAAVMPLSSCTSSCMPGRRCCTGMYLSWYSTRSPRYDVTCLFFHGKRGCSEAAPLGVYLRAICGEAAQVQGVRNV